MLAVETGSITKGGTPEKTNCLSIQATHVWDPYSVIGEFGGTPEVDGLPVPTSVAQLTQNKRSFQLAITNAIAGAKYACTPLIALASYPGCAAPLERGENPVSSRG